MIEREEYFMWKEPAVIDGEERLLTPWGDPQEYEYPFNYIFDTPEAAKRVKESDDFGPSSEETGWVLCKVTVEVVK